MKREHRLTPYTEINSKWIKDLNVKTRNHKTPRGEHRQNTLRHKSQQDPRVLETKAKINKWDLMKLKSFCTTKKL